MWFNSNDKGNAFFFLATFLTLKNRQTQQTVENGKEPTCCRMTTLLE